ncbi:ABC-three component system protein [Buttiauxella noackiae]|uniref:ABC-three component system protein n=1 Tax=Buttiauxella noackiae TaxID=82992 RepID=UPI0005577E4E|nr:ABC-three component system protein [Buttiauxella noackiae]
MITEEASSKIVGFLYQIERAMYRIFSSENDSCVFGVETSDDVVEEITFDNGQWHVFFEQDKHALSTRPQPFQNSSKNLWHTLHIWLSTMSQTRKKYDVITYCLATNKNVGINTLAHLISEANSEIEINSVLVALKKQANIITGSVKQIADKVLNYSDEELKFLIKNIEMLDQHGTHSGRDPKQATINLFHLPSGVIEHSESIYCALFGFMCDQCLTSWRKQQPAELTKEPFSNLLNAEIQKIKRKSFIDQPIFNTEFKKFMEQDNSEHLFIKQLQSIDLSTESCNKALREYWAFYAERVRLQSSGEIPSSAWDEREYALYERWEQVREHIEIKGDDTKSLPVLKKIYTSTVGDYKASLNGHPTEYFYFTTGNYHDLAKSPHKDTFIYWHDDFQYHQEN